ncbi:MAG TPA: RagB/SusD family nutrient uptake outer membrane protein [Flavisolibacter sp.]|nr:RagB/SusD family nutrient uptake outer membrane protein [Flavisolibacter sp.]
MKAIRINYKQAGVALLLVAVLSSCKKFVELGPPPTQTVQEDVFKTDATATSAILGLYSGQPYGSLYIPLSGYTGMSADDIKYSTSDPTLDEFKNNAISITNNANANIWYYAFMEIKNANYAISGLSRSTTLTPAVKDQLTGEAKFHRALMFFYLVNLYGDVPMPLTDDAIAAAALPRTPSAQVWTQIIADLTDAQNLLPTAYQGTFRARVNKSAATTLLARVYLYTKDYAKAEAEATKVISSGTYGLQPPANAFINTSNEIIWQIANTTGVSTFGANFLAAAGSIPTYTMYDTLYRSFEANDLRKANWTGTTTVGTTTYYFVNKYKVRTGTGNEYNVVLRYAELFLIRAEARAQQNNLSGAKADLDVIRARAGLSGVSSTLTQAEMLLAIEQERKVELFGEWGHRWLDLKRTSRADAVIGGEKPATWQSTDALYPVPEQQRQLNVKLSQNPGY